MTFDEVQRSIRGRRFWLGLNNRARNSRLPFLISGRVMPGHRSPGGLQRFVSMQPAVPNRFAPSARRRGSPQATRDHRLEALSVWCDPAGLAR